MTMTGTKHHCIGSGATTSVVGGEVMSQRIGSLICVVVSEVRRQHGERKLETGAG